jgi:hypothetical protein
LQWEGRRFQIPPQEIGAVRVRPGDILFGDIDGVLWFLAKPRRKLSPPRICL